MVFVLSVSPTAMVIWRPEPRLGVSSDRLEEPWIKLGTPGYKASGLSGFFKNDSAILRYLHFQCKQDLLCLRQGFEHGF